ncbi:Uma2 family endonuclease [Limnoraphis robusta Tam1]|uniref:Uma2 family endonuclease n=1 Tax=Limnoraphis robusta CCNP1315 TaxID=3110306 RepID=A0ABU5TQZ3_9CYAN|nr:Uma2 family endonuclease [Limnoraphis robusta]MEA5497562.1 Uma2 family endonuclease [Limnoraphis robusta BA-68 BA1]MEA5517345.1 Uma2 family endonuclease [Limnoraphis robusta CCNP1315]MEA5542975.1 Uma2 family endonuclease [Limnoraphis robusta Tam1]MEA5546066.1 Uma2 family endonuclease [Limnoraphis robusta CCNP1324]
MTIAQDLETLQTQTELEDIEFPPGDLESKEPPLESYLHLQQLLFLMKCLDWLWQDRNDYFAAGNLTIYYSPEQKKTDNFRGPDFFVVLNTERKPRKSWVVWEEGGKYPNVIIELLSKSTANVDRTNKKEIYQDIFRTPEYFWFSPETLEFKGFGLTLGQYQDLQPNEQGFLWSEQLQLFLGVYEQKLRFFTPEGILVPTPEESAKTAEKRASEAEETSRKTQEELEAERQQRQAERQRNERLAAKLRELNIDPDTL